MAAEAAKPGEGSLYLEDIRRDIEREDRNVQYHLAATLPIQGFMIAALTVLLMGTKDPVTPELDKIRTFGPFAFCVIGLVTSLASLLGIIAARVALGRSINAWKAIEPEQKAGRTDPYGGGKLHFWGAQSAYAVGGSMPVFWFLILLFLWRY